jgi:glutamine synthetase
VSYLDDHPEIASIRTIAADLNGQPRGKRIARRFADKADRRDAVSVLGPQPRHLGRGYRGQPPRLPRRRSRRRPETHRARLSSRAVALLAHRASADLDVPRGWPPYDGDPRQALARVIDRYTALGLTPVVATELEFYLIDDGAEPRVPPSPRSGKRRHQAEILALRQLDAWDGFFTRLYEACEAMDIPADTTISEAGPGQFEVNLMHQPDALKAADDAWFFKLLVKGLAREHGVTASFMAKPYADYAGNGLHAHFSVLDSDGANIFDERHEGGADLLGHAIAGCLAAMPGSTLIFAPHGTSYDRFVPGAHAPTGNRLGA